jgi:hypothetical protein
MRKCDAEPEPESLPVEFSPEERRRLLEDIGWLCLAPAPSAAHSSVALTSTSEPSDLPAASSPFLRLKRLEHFWTQAQAVIPALLRQPQTALEAAVRSLPLDRARGDAFTIREIAHSPAAQIALLTPSRRMPTVRERHAALTHDTPANRLLVGIWAQMEREANALAHLAAYCEDSEAEALARMLAGSAGELRRYSLWRDLTPMPSEQIVGMLPALSAASPLSYRVLFEKWAEYAATAAFEWSGVAALTSDARAGWQLYEIWCFGQIVQALEKLGATRQDTAAIRIMADGLHLVPATGRASCLTFALPNGRRKSSLLRLYYQPLFVSANRKLNAAPEEAEAADDLSGYVSRSHAMQPDYALSTRGKLILFDAKLRTYSAPQSEQTDIDKMHAYRDGIIRKNTAGRTSAVTAAWSLFAGIAKEKSPLDAIRAYPAPTDAEPFGTGEIGAIKLRPLDSETVPRLSRLLNHLL